MFRNPLSADRLARNGNPFTGRSLLAVSGNKLRVRVGIGHIRPGDVIDPLRRRAVDSAVGYDITDDRPDNDPSRNRSPDAPAVPASTAPSVVPVMPGIGCRRERQRKRYGENKDKGKSFLHNLYYTTIIVFLQS